MGHRLTVPCVVCGAECGAWRQCHHHGCALDVAVCARCGGDPQAVARMQEHLFREHEQTPRVVLPPSEI